MNHQYFLTIFIYPYIVSETLPNKEQYMTPEQKKEVTEGPVYQILDKWQKLDGIHMTSKITNLCDDLGICRSYFMNKIKRGHRKPRELVMGKLMFRMDKSGIPNYKVLEHFRYAENAIDVNKDDV